jgi:protein SCO1/2
VRAPRRTLLVIALALASRSPAAADLAMPRALDGIAVSEHPGAVLPLAARLLDEDGREVRLGHFFDGRRPVLMTFAYGRCPMLCSLVLDGEATAVAALPRKAAARLVTISIDPRDTPAEAAARGRALRARVGTGTGADDWAFLTGAAAEVRRIASVVGFEYRRDPETGDIAHPSVLVAITPDARVARYVYGVSFDPAEVAVAIDAAARGDVGASLTQALIQCFRYMPVVRRHSGAVALFLRGGAVAMLAGLGGVFVLARRRRRTP